MTLWLRILAAFVNSRSSVPSTHIWQLKTTSCSKYRGSNVLFWSLQASYAHEHTCIHTGKIKLGKQKKNVGRLSVLWMYRLFSCDLPATWWLNTNTTSKHYWRHKSCRIYIEKDTFVHIAMSCNLMWHTWACTNIGWD